MKFDMFKAIDQASAELDKPVVSVRLHDRVYYIRIEVIKDGQRHQEQLAITSYDVSGNLYLDFNERFKGMLYNLKHRPAKLSELSDNG